MSYPEMGPPEFQSPIVITQSSLSGLPRRRQILIGVLEQISRVRSMVRHQRKPLGEDLARGITASLLEAETRIRQTIEGEDKSD